MAVQIEPSEFVSKFVSIPEGSSMYFSNSAEYAQIFALMLGETDISNQIQEIKNNTSPEIGIELFRIETEVIRWISYPDKRIVFEFSNGHHKEFKVSFLYNELKKVRFNLFSMVSALMVKHKIQFPINFNAPTIKAKSLRKDFTKPRY